MLPPGKPRRGEASTAPRSNARHGAGHLRFGRLVSNAKLRRRWVQPRHTSARQRAHGSLLSLLATPHRYLRSHMAREDAVQTPPKPCSFAPYVWAFLSIFRARHTPPLDGAAWPWVQPTTSRSRHPHDFEGMPVLGAMFCWGCIPGGGGGKPWVQPNAEGCESRSASSLRAGTSRERAHSQKGSTSAGIVATRASTTDRRLCTSGG